jgi:hypothetical protein
MSANKIKRRVVRKVVRRDEYKPDLPKRYKKPNNTDEPQDWKLHDMVPLRPEGRRAYGRPKGCNSNTIQRKKTFLEALHHTFGNILMATRQTGIPREAHYLWMKTDPLYKEEYYKAIEERHDFVEHQLMTAIKQLQPTVMIHYSKTQMAHRGWREQQALEISGPNGSPMETKSNINVSVLKNEVVPEAVVSILKTLVSDNDKVEGAIKKLAR